MKNMKKSVYVFWGIAAFGVLGAILSIPNLQNMLIYFALIVVFGALGYWQFRKGQAEQPAESPKEKPEEAEQPAESPKEKPEEAEQPAESPKEKPEEKVPEGKEKKQDKPTVKTAEGASAEPKAAQPSAMERSAPREESKIKAEEHDKPTAKAVEYAMPEIKTAQPPAMERSVPREEPKIKVEYAMPEIKTAQPPAMERSVPREEPKIKAEEHDKPTAKAVEYAMPETKAAQPSSVNEIDYGFHSDDDYDYWKVKVAGVTFKNGRKSRQTILKKIFFRDEPFNKDECHSCTLRRGEYEGEPSFAVCVHDDIIGFIPREKVQYFYDNFYRCDGITAIRVFSEHDIIGARVVVRFRRNADETSKDAPQEVTTEAVLETSNTKAQFWSDDEDECDEVESEDNAAADETAAQPAKTEAADKPASVFFGQVVVTEGEFRSFTRRKLNEILREKGAIIESTITGNTDFYIVGDIPLEKLDSNCLSSNGRKLERLLDKGECYATELDEDKLLALLAEE